MEDTGPGPDAGTGRTAEEAVPAETPEKSVGEAASARERQDEEKPASRPEKGRITAEELKIAEQKAVQRLTEKGAAGKDSEYEAAGGITFSTREYKYYGYKTRLKEKIEGIWKYPYDAARQGIYGDLVIQFTILKDGKLGEVRLVRTSGYKVLDDAAMKALRDAAPFWPLPEEWREEAFTIRGHFMYTLSGIYIR